MMGFDLKKYFLSGIFIETGTEHGNGVRRALDAGYTEIHSVELAPNFYRGCIDLYWNDDNVHLYCGSSLDFLPIIMKHVQKPATIWLDAHVDNNYIQTDVKCPLIQELEIIGAVGNQTEIKDHTILIDDRRLFGQEGDWGKNISEDEVISKLMEVNHKYTIKYENGIEENDIIVAAY